MRYQQVFSITLLMIVSLCAPMGIFAQLLPLSLDARIGEAEAILEGEVIAAEAFWDDSRRSIFTAYTVDISRQFKGAPVEDHVTLVVEGGTVGMERVHVTHTMELEEGDVGLFFLKVASLEASASKVGTSEAFMSTSGAQSFVRYLPGQGQAVDPFSQYRAMEALYAPIEQYVGQAPRVLRAFDGNDFLGDTALANGASAKGHGHVHRPQVAAITSMSVGDGSPTAGALEVLTISGTGFTDGAGAAASGSAGILFDNADDGAGGAFSSVPFNNLRVQSYTDTQIQVQIPQGAGTGRVIVVDNAGNQSPDVVADDLTVDFAITNEVIGGSGVFANAYRIADLYDDNGSGGYTFTYHSDFESGSAKAPFERALESLRCNASIYVNFDVAGAATANQCTADDGTNSVSFDNVSCELPSGTLGRATGRFSGQTDGTNVNWRVTEIDIIFNADKSWNFGTGAPGGTENDFESVALHEIGHTLGLAHVNDASKVMNFSITTGTTSRTVTSEMTSGGAFIMGLSTAAQGAPEGGTSPMTALSAGNCVLPVELVSFDALQTDGVVVLQWATATETNNAGFEIEYAYAGEAFEQVGFVPGAGTTLQTQTYEHRLSDLEPGTYQFRLRQIDFDGAFEYSLIAETTIELAEAFHLTEAYPNPFNATTQVRLMLRQQEEVRVTAFDALGRQIDVLHNGPLVAQEAHTFALNLAEQPSGVYFVRIQGETFAATRQVLLVK